MRIFSGPAVVAVLVLGLLAGCSLGGAEPSSRPSGGDPVGETVPELAWSAELKPLSRAVVVDRTAIVLAQVRGREIDVVALDTGSGEVRWSRPWSPGQIPNGYTMDPATGKLGGRDVVVLQDPGKDISELGRPWPLLAVDVVTGEEVSRTRPVEVVGPIGDCPGGSGTCAGVTDEDGGPDLVLRVHPGGRLEPDRSALPAGAFEIGPRGLFAQFVDRPAAWGTGPGSDVEIGRFARGKIRWTTSLMLLQGPGYETARGYSFDWDPATRSWVGGIGAVIDEEQITRYEAGRTGEIELGVPQLVAIAADGTRRWGQRGLSRCGLDVTAEDGRMVAVRCRASGTQIEQKGKDKRFRDLSVVLEGYDLMTGATTWSRPLTHRQAKGLYTDHPLVSGPDTSWVLVDRPGGGVEQLLTENGTVTPVDDGIFLCDVDPRLFRYAQGTEISRQRARDDLDRTCTARGARTAGTPRADALRAEGVAAGDLHLVTTKEGVLAYRT